MPIPQDDEFIRFAVAGGHLTDEEGEQALQSLRDIEALGGTASAPEMLERLELLTTRQIGQIHEAIAQSKSATTVPKQLGEYELLEALGQGATGTVFKARQPSRERIVAIKVLAPTLARQEDYVARFRREARAAASLTHPTIVSPIDVGEDQGFYYLVAEYVAGESLATMLAREGRLPESQALAVATEVAAALDHANAKGILHRDLRPENILIAIDGQVRVTDFGLAKPIGADAPTARDAERFLASPVYLAPEELRSDSDVDCRADIYSLGILLFQMLTGDVPFKGPTAMAVAAAAVSQPVPSVRSLVPDARIATGRAVERMTAKDRSARYSSPADVHAALKSAAGAQAPAAAAAAPARPLAPRPAGQAAAGAQRPAARRQRSKAGKYIIGTIGIAIHVLLFAWLGPKVLKRFEQSPTARRVRTAAPPAPVTSAVPVVPKTSASALPMDDPALLRELQKELDGAVLFARSNPDAYATRLARLERVIDRFSGSRKRRLPEEGHNVLAALQDELARARDAQRKAADDEMSKRRARADERMQAGRIADALAVFDNFPAELSSRDVMSRVRDARDAIRGQALAEFKARDAKAKALIKEGRLEHAKDIYLAVRSWGIRDVKTAATKAIGDIDRLITQRTAAALVGAKEAYPKLVRSLVDLLGQRDYKAARAEIDAALVDTKLASVRERVRIFQELVRGAAEVWAQVGAGAKTLQEGDVVRFGGVAGQYLRIEGDKIYVKIGGGVAARDLRELSSVDAVSLAARALDESAAPVQVKIGLFLIADRDYERARSLLAKAKAAGADASVGFDLLGRIAPRPCPTCDCAKGIACPGCDGNGYTHVQKTKCDSCNGRGWFLCRKCRGSGALVCAQCGGRGTLLGSGFRCLACTGTGRVDCASCTRGKLRCKKCKADGIVTTYTVCQRCKGKKKIACPKCKAKGYLPPLDLPPASK